MLQSQFLSASPTPSTDTDTPSAVDPHAEPSRIPTMTDEELSIARYNSSVRLLSTWEDIVNRYKDVPAEEDDEIDLRSGKLIRDRGRLKKMRGARRFGFFVGALHGEDDVEESSEDEPPSDQQSDDGDARGQTTERRKSQSRRPSHAGSRTGSVGPPVAPTGDSFFAPRRQLAEIDPKDLETFLAENQRLMANFKDEVDDFEGIDEVTIYDGETDRESVYGRTDAEDSDTDDTTDDSDSSSQSSGPEDESRRASRGPVGTSAQPLAPAHRPAVHGPAYPIHRSEPASTRPELNDYDHDPILPELPSMPGYPTIEWHRQELPTAASLPRLHYADTYAPGFRYGTSSWTSISPHVLFNVAREYDPVNVPIGTNEPFVPANLDLPEGAVVYKPSEVLVRTAAEARMYAIWKRDKMKRLWKRQRERTRVAEAKRLEEELLKPPSEHGGSPQRDASSQSQSQPSASFFAHPDTGVSSWAAEMANLLQAKPERAAVTRPQVPPLATFYPPQPKLCRVCLAYGRDLVASRCPGGSHVHRCTGGDPDVTKLVFPRQCLRCLFQGREDLAKHCRGRKKPIQCIYGPKDKMPGFESTCERCRKEGRLEEMYVCKGRTSQWKCDQGRAALEEMERKDEVRRVERGGSDQGDSSDDEEGSDEGEGEPDLSDEVEANSTDETDENEVEAEWDSDQSSGTSEELESENESEEESDDSGEDEREEKRRSKKKQRRQQQERIRPKRSLPRKSYAIDKMFDAAMLGSDETEMESEETTDSD